MSLVYQIMNALLPFECFRFHYMKHALLAILVAAMWGYKKVAKKKLSPIGLIILSAVLGMVIF